MHLWLQLTLAAVMLLAAVLEPVKCGREELLNDSRLFPLREPALLFEEFIHKHQKPYGNDLREKVKRFKIFRTNMEKIRHLNLNEQGSAVYGITQFSDLTEEEFRDQYLGLRPDLYQPPNGGESMEPDSWYYEPDEAVPNKFDWRSVKGVVTGVKNQEMCGSCWAFSTTGNVEGVWAVAKNESVSLSEQELVDCDTFDQGCNGGLPVNAYKTIIKLGGLESESDYPYDAKQEKCHFNRRLSHVRINSYVEMPKNETYMMNYLFKNGPISIGLNANAMQFYFGGIANPPSFLCSPNDLNHGVLIVGYGIGQTRILHRTYPYWIIKNSWGKSWGEKGYYRLARGTNRCGVAEMASSAVV